MKNELKLGLALVLFANMTYADGGLLTPAVPVKPVLAPVVTQRTYHLHARELATDVDRLIGSMKMKLNNHRTQSSSIQIASFTIPFQIPRAVVDIDCGTFCPDLGDGYFYVNDVNLSRADFLSRVGSFELALEFEDAGREIKGYHSLLGDDGMPDFELNRPRLSLTALPNLVSGQVTLLFSNAKLSADIHSTGGCNIGGVDICNKIFGTDRKVEKGVEGASQNALNGNLVQAALKTAISQFLRSRGVNGTIIRVGLAGEDLQVTVRL